MLFSMLAVGCDGVWAMAGGWLEARVRVFVSFSFWFVFADGGFWCVLVVLWAWC